mmetsp:Transcript_48889/g.130868  ORF Transcript_48889/g.130868 Transcript_48889/m.130868 type:complete len:248 (+) Transcript_48889:396-1139(+)
MASISFSFFASSTASCQPWKIDATRPPSLACVMRCRTDFAPSFWVFMKLSTFISAALTASFISLSFLYWTMCCTQAAKTVARSPSSLPVLSLDMTFFALFAEDSENFLNCASKEAISALPSLFLLMLSASTFKALTTFPISVACDSAAVRLSTDLTLESWEALYSMSFLCASLICSSYSLRISFSRLSFFTRSIQATKLVLRRTFSLPDTCAMRTAADLVLDSCWIPSTSALACAKAFCVDMELAWL